MFIGVSPLAWRNLSTLDDFILLQPYFLKADIGDPITPELEKRTKQARSVRIRAV